MGISYSVDTSDAAATAMVRERPMSFKDSVEICRHVKGAPVEDALTTLSRVIDGDEPVPMKQHNSDVGHRSDLDGWDAGRYPEKATEGVVKALENAVANAEHQGHDTEALRVEHLAAHKVGEAEGMQPRAMGRATPSNTPLVDVEVVLSSAEAAEAEAEETDQETSEEQAPGPDETEDAAGDGDATATDETEDAAGDGDATATEATDGDAEDAAEDAGEDAAAPEDAPASIDEIEGVGASKADALRDAGFDSVDAVRSASEDELSEVEGVGPALAARIKADVGGLEADDDGGDA